MSPIQRQTTFGLVVGTDLSAANGTYAWKGVPYAKPPVGELRWKAPADPDPWTSPRLTQQFGHACAQASRLYGPGLNNKYDATIGTSLGKTVGSEDCLYLNIWRPASAAAQLPVIVWVHGGSNISGYTADPMYDGANLARTANAVFVSVNYRLGVLGFFNLGQLKTGNPLDDSGNFALLDVIKALQFVHRNIAAFGGDPGNVTLMGESAGAVNVYALMTSPLLVDANPALVHKLLPISGGISPASELPAGSVATLAPAAAFRDQADLLLRELIIGDGQAADAAGATALVASKSASEIAAYVRSKSADAIWTTIADEAGARQRRRIGTDSRRPRAAVESDCRHQSRTLRERADARRQHARRRQAVPDACCRSSAAAVGRLLNDAAVFSTAFNYNPEAAPTTTVEQWIPASYLPATTPGSGFNAKTEQLTRVFFLASRDSVLNALKTQQSNIWYYRFDWDELPPPFDVIYGASHAFDLPFAFGNFGPSLYANISYTRGNEAGRLALSDAMMRSIGAFARTGDPNNPALGVTWPTWPSMLLFDATPTAKAISVQ